MRLVSIIIVTSNLVAFGPLAAQGRMVLPPPTHIRYSALPSDSTREAEVLIQRGDSLWVSSLRHGDTSVITISSLKRLDVSLGTSGHALRGAMKGFIAGALIGGALGALSPPCDSCFFDWSRSQMAGILGGTFGVIGAGVGALAGTGQRSERWEAVPLPSIAGVTLLVRPQAIGYKVGVRIPIF